MRHRLVVYSDFLCPWCYVGFVRLGDVEAEFGDDVEVQWKSFLLRPEPRPGRSLERFQQYTQSWSRPAGEEPRARFQVWDGEAGPPSHSVPPHVTLKRAEGLGAAEAARLRRRMFEAYFGESRDITATDTLRSLWDEAGLPSEAFGPADDPALTRAVFQDYREAIECGASGVPAVRLAESDFVLTGAQPSETYLRWLRRQEDRATASQP